MQKIYLACALYPHVSGVFNQKLMKSFLDLSYYRRWETKFPIKLHPIKERKLFEKNISLYRFEKEFAEREHSKFILESFYSEEDLRILNQTIDKHGVFFEKFFVQHLRRRLSEIEIDKTVYYKIENLNPFKKEDEVMRKPQGLTAGNYSHIYFNTLFYHMF